jgi:hypothetical protein
MSAETMIAIMTTLAGIAAAAKAVAEARKAKYEARKAEAEAMRADTEASRADEAEKTTGAVIDGIENAKRTMGESDLAHYLQEEIRSVAIERGVEGKLSGMVKQARETRGLDRGKLLEKLED